LKAIDREAKVFHALGGIIAVLYQGRRSGKGKNWDNKLGTVPNYSLESQLVSAFGFVGPSVIVVANELNMIALTVEFHLEVKPDNAL
jgi:hypothetical protein